MNTMFTKYDLINRKNWLPKLGRYSIGLCVLFLLSIKGMAIYNVAFYLLLIAFLIYSVQMRKVPQLPDKRILSAYVIFCGSLLIAGILHGEMIGVKGAAGYVYRTLPFLLLFFGIHSFGSKEMVYKSFLAGLFVNAGIVLYWYLQVWNRQGRLSIIDNPNLTVEVLSISLIFGLLAVYEYRHSKMLMLTGMISSVVLMLGIWWTGSRGGAMGLLAGVFLTCFCHIFAKNKDRFKRPIIVSVIAMIVGSLLILGLTAGLMPRDTSDRARICIYKSAVQMFVDHPVAGVGYDNYGKEYMNYIQPDAPVREPFPHAHNDFLQLLATTGSVGATGFLIFSLVFLWILLKKIFSYSEKPIFLAMLCTFIAMYLHGLVDMAMLYNTGTRMVFGMLGITLAIGDRKEDNDELH